MSASPAAVPAGPRVLRERPTVRTPRPPDRAVLLGIGAALGGRQGDRRPHDQRALRLESCTLVTTPSAASIAHLHDRMPAILPPDRYAEWLDPSNDDLARLDRLLVPYDATALSARPVSRRVNDARNEGAELIEPASDPATGRLI